MESLPKEWADIQPDEIYETTEGLLFPLAQNKFN